jgi:hypothetical protein
VHPQPQTPAQSEAAAPKPTPAAQPSPQPMVTSTTNAATRQEAARAIGEVNQRLAQAGGAGTSANQDAQINVIRKLRDDAQEAFNEQDYLTARSLAQKASVLAGQLPASPPPAEGGMR